MYRYSGINDPNRHSYEPLVLSEIEAQVKVVSALSLGSFMDEDFPHPLSRSVTSDLVSFLFSVHLRPSVFLLVMFGRGSCRGSDF